MEKINTCAVCAACWQGSPKLCAGCFRAVYCSQFCQKEHWKIHKKVCKKTPREAKNTNLTSVTSLLLEILENDKLNESDSNFCRELLGQVKKLNFSRSPLDLGSIENLKQFRQNTPITYELIRNPKYREVIRLMQCLKLELVSAMATSTRMLKMAKDDTELTLLKEFEGRRCLIASDEKNEPVAGLSVAVARGKIFGIGTRWHQKLVKHEVMGHSGEAPPHLIENIFMRMVEQPNYHLFSFDVTRNEYVDYAHDVAAIKLWINNNRA
jgi:hypothetical protein